MSVLDEKPKVELAWQCCSWKSFCTSKELLMLSIFMVIMWFYLMYITNFKYLPEGWFYNLTRRRVQHCRKCCQKEINRNTTPACSHSLCQSTLANWDTNKGPYPSNFGIVEKSAYDATEATELSQWISSY
jgi:hypothetical protein